MTASREFCHAAVAGLLAAADVHLTRLAGRVEQLDRLCGSLGGELGRVRVRADRADVFLAQLRHLERHVAHKG